MWSIVQEYKLMALKPFIGQSRILKKRWTIHHGIKHQAYAIVAGVWQCHWDYLLDGVNENVARIHPVAEFPTEANDLQSSV